MVFADLHVHTDVSDGTLSLADVPSAARRSEVDVVGITDHDRVHPDLSVPVTERDGIVIVSGIELRVETPEQRVDLLGYGVTPTKSLVAELDRIQRDRIRRGRAITECVEDRLGISLDVDLVAGVGRPHVARAVVDHPDTSQERVGAVFDELIGEDEPCFESRNIPAIETAIPLLRDASSLVGLAHPFRYPDPEAALALCDRLDAVETAYPYDGSRGHPTGGENDTLLQEVVEANELLETGGSDAHGHELGAAGLTAAEYEPIAQRLPVP